jgi:hypothetical protein
MSQFDDEPKENRALIPFSDNLPYDKNRVIQEAKFCLQVEIAARFEVGKRLLLLREHEGVTTLLQILEENFAGMNRMTAWRYMLFAKKAADLPKFQAWADGRGNWCKALALLEACDEEDLAEFEEGGDILGLKTDEIERLSVKQLQKALRLAQEKQEKAVKKATEQTAQENVRLKEEVADLTAALSEPDIEAAMTIIKAVDKKIMEATQLMRKIPWGLVEREEAIRSLLIGVVGLQTTMIQRLEDNLLKAERVARIAEAGDEE